MKKAVLGFVLACLFSVFPHAAVAEVPSHETSFFHLEKENTTVQPYVPVGVTIGLLQANGQNFTTKPEGKVFLWATEINGSQPLPVLEVVPRSFEKQVPMHPVAANPAVIIMDASALQEQTSFKVRFTKGGSYELKAMVLGPKELPYQANRQQYYEQQLLRSAQKSARTVHVGTTPALDVSYLIFSPSVNGVELPGGNATPPRGVTIKDVTLPVHEDGVTPTALAIQLYRSNGLSVGRDVPVYVSTSGKNIRLSQREIRTDDHGRCVVYLNGKAGNNDYLGIRMIKNDAPVLIKLSSYTYHPQRVYLGLGSHSMDVDGRSVDLATPAVIKNGRTYIPYRSIGEILGAKMEYNQTIHTITTYFESKVITMTLGFDSYAIDNKVMKMDAKPFITANNHTMVPLRVIAEATGYNVRAVSDSSGRTKGILFTKFAM